MKNLKELQMKTQELSKDIDDVLRRSTYYDYSDLSGLEINRQDSDELQLWYELRNIMEMLIEVKGNINFLSCPVKEVSALHKNSSGRYEKEQGHVFTCGSTFEALIDDGYQDVPYWMRTRLESKEGAYYLVGIHGVSLDDLKVRIREARY